MEKSHEASCIEKYTLPMEQHIHIERSSWVLCTNIHLNSHSLFFHSSPSSSCSSLSQSHCMPTPFVYDCLCVSVCYLCIWYEKGNKVGKFYLNRAHENTKLETLLEQPTNESREAKKNVLNTVENAGASLPSSNCICWRHKKCSFEQQDQHSHKRINRGIRKKTTSAAKEWERARKRFKSKHNIIMKDLLMLRFFRYFLFVLCFFAALLFSVYFFYG